MLALITGLLAARVECAHGAAGRRSIQLGMLAGIALAAAMAVLRTTTSRVDLGLWNIRMSVASLVLFILFLIATALGKKIKVFGLFACVSAALFAAVTFAYTIPTVMLYPHAVLLTEKSVFSTAFLVKMIGVVFGVILTFVAGFAVYKAGLRLGGGLILALAAAAAALNVVRMMGAALGTMLARRFIPSNHTLFLFAKNVVNFDKWFIFAVMAIAAVVPVVLWIRSLHVNEPYSNNAQRRKIVAKWRNIRRWSTTSLICVALAGVTITAIEAYANREVELSPIEDAVIEDGFVIVPFEQVNDGHLHRFGYTTDAGTVIRFIVIQKPNSSAYGIGLDACDICGETGYYEKDGQVVCNLCDVVMNINTIGFKGGCNPIVIRYEVHDGKIWVPIEGLLEYEVEFTR